MHEVRQIIQRLRLGEANRKVARAQQVGRDTVAKIRGIANERGLARSAEPDARRCDARRVLQGLWQESAEHLHSRAVPGGSACLACPRHSGEHHAPGARAQARLCRQRPLSVLWTMRPSTATSGASLRANCSAVLT